MTSVLPGPNDLTETEQNMQAGGVAPTASAQQDYFGFGKSQNFMLPDGVSYVVLKAMNEGARSEFQEATSKNVRIFKGSGDASLRVNPAEERKILLKVSIVNWNLKSVNPMNGQTVDVQFADNKLDQFLREADPSIIDAIEARVRELNPWMRDQETVEAIDEEIESLKSRRQELISRQESKSAIS